jgi:hypothetical protein
MNVRAGGSRAALGFTVKSGWAATVLLIGSPASPRLADSCRIDLSDPAIPESRQPYHAGFGTARSSGAELKRLVTSVRRFGRRSVMSVVETYATGHAFTGAGLVVGSLNDPGRIANQHIRIHALEGQLFREVVEQALAAGGLPCSVWRERDLYGAAAKVLRDRRPMACRTEGGSRCGLARVGRGWPWTITSAKLATQAGTAGLRVLPPLQRPRGRCRRPGIFRPRVFRIPSA